VDERDKSKSSKSKDEVSQRRADRYGGKAGLQYDRDVRKFVDEGGVEQAATDARAAVDGPEGPSLHEAEMEGKERAQPSLSDRARQAWHRLGRAARAAIHELRR